MAINDKSTYKLQAKNLKKKAKLEGLKKIMEKWKGKPLHGQYQK